MLSLLIVVIVWVATTIPLVQTISCPGDLEAGQRCRAECQARGASHRPWVFSALFSDLQCYTMDQIVLPKMMIYLSWHSYKTSAPSWQKIEKIENMIHTCNHDMIYIYTLYTQYNQIWIHWSPWCSSHAPHILPLIHLRCCLPPGPWRFSTPLVVGYWETKERAW